MEGEEAGEGVPPLVAAVQAGDLLRVRRLLAAGHNPDTGAPLA